LLFFSFLSFSLSPVDSLSLFSFFFFTFESKNSEQNEKQNTFAEDLIDVLTVENDKSEKVTFVNRKLLN
jgi:hypothetical protein